jgi:hypothetical protein
MIIFRLFLFAATLSLAWRYYHTASDVNFIIIAMQVLVLPVVLFQLYFAWQRQFSFVHFQQPLTRAAGKYWLTIFNRLSFLFIAGWAGKLAMSQWQYTEAAYQQEQVKFYLLFAVLGLAAIFVRRQIDGLFNLLILIMSATLGFEVYQAKTLPEMADSVVLQSPYEESFYIADGGNSRLTSIMKVGGRSDRKYGIYMVATEHAFQPEQPMPNGYWGNFGANILAPAAGTVVQVVDGNPDIEVDAFSADGGPGNFILIQLASEQYVMLAHLKLGSFQVAEGDHVTAGQVLAQAGKSGSVSLSATFLAVYANPDIFSPDNRSYPIYFDQVRDLSDPQRVGPFFAVRNDLFSPFIAE